MKGKMLALAAVALVGLVALSCRRDDQASVGDYFEEVNPLLERASVATENWTRLADELAEADLTNISSAEYRNRLRASLDAATEAYVASRDALEEIRVIVPPEECEGLHGAVVEALRLSERGFQDIKSYLESGLRTGRPDEEQRARANDLLNAADREKERGLSQAATSDCE